MNKIWFNGKIHEGPLALAADDRGLTLGDGIFETMLVRDGVALWRAEHLLRMESAARALGIPYPRAAIAAAVDGLVSNAMSHHVLRLTLTRGSGGRGLAAQPEHSCLIATLSDFDPALQFQPVTLQTSRIERNLKSPTSYLKTLSYVDQVMAAREAVNDGFDDALMFNTKGRVACCTIGNIFLQIDDTLVTPSLYEGILNGIMRGVFIEAAKHAGFRVKERLVRLPDLDKAEAMFVTNSLRYVRPVVRFDDRLLQPPHATLEKMRPILKMMEHEQITET